MSETFPSGGSMHASVKLEGIDGRAPQERVPAGNHMLVLKIKPCMFKFRALIWNCGRLIKSEKRYPEDDYMDISGNSRVNTCPFRGMFGGKIFGLIAISTNKVNTHLAYRSQTGFLVSFLIYHLFMDIEYPWEDNGWRGTRVWFRRGCLRDGNYFQGRQQARKLPNLNVRR